MIFTTKEGERGAEYFSKDIAHILIEPKPKHYLKAPENK